MSRLSGKSAKQRRKERKRSVAYQPADVRNEQPHYKQSVKKRS